MIRCGCVNHKGDRLISSDLFYKNKGHSTAHNRICKECFLTGRYGDLRKRRKVCVIPEFDVSIQKWCNRCETVKLHSEFPVCSEKKDGLNPNCKECRNDMKRKYIEKKKNATTATSTAVNTENDTTTSSSN